MLGILYWAFWALLLVVVLLIWLYTPGYIKGNIIEKKLKPVPEVPYGKLPFLGHVIEMLKAPPWDTMSGWCHKYGPIVRFRFFNENYIAICDKESLKRVLNSKFMIYQKDKNTYAPFDCLLGTGLVTSEGELWRRQRTLVSPAFRVEILEDAVRIAKAAADRLSLKLETLRGTKKPVEMAEEFRKLTLQVIGEAVLSLSAEESNEVFPRLYLPIAEEANMRTWFPWRKFLPTPHNYRYNRAVIELNSFVTNLIHTRRREFLEGNRKDDILDRILEAAKDEPWNETSVIQLRDEIKTFLFAGHETSSTMLTWTLYELSQNPDCLAKVREEATKFLTPEGDLPDFEVCKKEFNYTVQCLKEALRKYSIVPVVTRVATEDDELGGHFIPKDTHIIIAIQAVHHDEKNWPEPWKFDPDRFAEPIDTWSWIPFIAGPRACVGQYFALLETKLVLALLLNKFTFSPAPNNLGKRHPKMIPVSSDDNMRMVID